MAKWKQTFLQIVVWLLIMEGISSIWEFVDVAVYGERRDGE